MTEQPWSVYLIRRRYGEFQTVVAPTIIRYVKGSVEWPRYVKKWPFLLCPGRWDVSEKEYAPFREDVMRELFVEGRHYTETAVYGRMVNAMEAGESTDESNVYPCGSRQELAEYFEKVLRLGASIEARGVRAPSNGPDGPADGITVRIARDGSLLKCREGTHRLAIARALGIPKVPVVLDLIHTAWARRAMAVTGRSGRAALEEAVALSLGTPSEESGVEQVGLGE